MEMTRAVGNRIRALREAAGLSQEELAHAAGQMNRGYLSELEGGKKSAGVETLARIAQALNVAPMELLRTRPRAKVPAAKPALHVRLGETVAGLAKNADPEVIRRFEALARAYFKAR